MVPLTPDTLERVEVMFLPDKREAARSLLETIARTTFRIASGRKCANWNRSALPC